MVRHTLGINVVLGLLAGNHTVYAPPAYEVVEQTRVYGRSLRSSSRDEEHHNHEHSVHWVRRTKHATLSVLLSYPLAFTPSPA